MGYREEPTMPVGIRLTDRDTSADAIRIRNDGASPVDVSGWYIVSDRGGEMVVLPEGTVVQPGAALTVGTLSTKAAVDLTWPQEKVWNKSKDDMASLYDVYGRLIDTLQ